MPERSTQEREARRITFNEIPQGYDDARPTYPPEVIDDLLELAHLSPGSRVLEIGCGTGQATVPLAERGLELTCIELGDQTAAFARSKLAPYPSVSVVNADFESWQPQAAGFDAVVAFASFHWIDPEVRFVKAAALLREGGCLGVTGGRQVRPLDGDSFFDAMLPIYAELTPDAAPLPRPEDVEDLSPEFDASGVFGPVRVRRRTFRVPRTIDQHLALIDTYSNHRMLEPPVRAELYARLRELAASRGQTTITQTLLAVVHVATRL